MFTEGLTIELALTIDGTAHEVESILDHTEANGYPLRSLIHEVVQSSMFRRR